LTLAFVLVNPSNLVIAGVHINQHQANGMAVFILAAIYLWQRFRKAKTTVASVEAMTV
jgi:hypothetical protein